MDNPHKGRTGIDRLIHATGYSAQGLRAAYAHESAFRQETWLAALLLPTAFWLGRDGTEITLLVGSVLLLMIVELLNSAIEATVDRISMDLHDLAKRAKDYGSAAVALSLIFCAGVWIHAIWHRFSTM